MEIEVIPADSVNQEELINDKSKKTTFREKWKDAGYRTKFYQSLSVCGTFFSLGLSAAQIGTTLPDLQIITNTDLQKASGFFTSGTAGFLAGTVLCGLLFGKVNADLMMFLSLFVGGVAFFFLPLCIYYELMIFVRFLTSLSGGFIDTCGNAVMMRLWGTEGEQLVQFLHFCFSLGGVLSPLYSEPFLAPKVVQSDGPINGTLGNTTNELSSNHSLSSTPTETDVKYAFWITGSLIIVLSLPLVPFYVMNRKKINKQKNEEKRNQRKLPRAFMLFTLLMICIFFWLYCCVEDTFASFLMSFLVREYEEVSKSKGAFATAIYWAFFAAGRFLMVFLSRVFSPVQLLAMCSISMVVAFTCFSLMAYYRIIEALIPLAALAGLSMSGIYAAGLSWAEAELLKVTGFVASAILVFSALPGVVNPLLLGYLMESFSNMWFCYLLLGQTILMLLLFVFLLSFTRFYLNRRFGSCGEGAKEATVNGGESLRKSFLESNTH